jgi:hypothetical protein
MTNSTVLTRAAEMWALSAANRWSTPGALARALDPDTRQTRALDLIDAALVDVAEGRCDRLIISMPPQEGKSSRVTTVGALWFLLRKRHWRIAIASYSEGLAVTFGRLIRNYIADHQGRDGTLDLGVRIAADNGAVTDWTLAGNRGGIRSVGIGTGLTGRPVDCLIIDDPIKDREQADSETYRERAKNWWRTVGSTRLAPGAPVILILCMTGDTPVLLASGIEKPLRDIQPGEAVATFTDEGEVTTSVVSNWMSQGEDDILTLSMASGRVVRANARHPFWVIDETGEGSWVQLGSLQAGMKVRCLTALTEGSSAPQVDATSPRSARACACLTTPEHAMQPVIGHRLHLMKAGGGSDSRVGMASRPETTIDFSLSRMGVVRSVEGMSAKSPSPRTGPKSSVSIIATTPELCEVCSATTATSSLLAGTRPTSSDGPLSTSVVSTDEPAGTTTTSRATCSASRTRTGGASSTSPPKPNIGPMRASPTSSAASLANTWTPPGSTSAPAWRVRRSNGSRPRSRSDRRHGRRSTRAAPRPRPVTSSPATSGGNTTPRSGSKMPTVAASSPGLQAEDVEMIQSWDFTFKDTASSDYVVGQVWMRRGARAYLLDQVRARMGFSEPPARRCST